jgi:hypothetical protein
MKALGTRRKRRRFKVPGTGNEHAIQSMFFTWVNFTREMQTSRRLKLIFRWIHAIPNGYLKTPFARLRGGKEGVRSGVHDVFIPAPNAGFSLTRPGIFGTLLGGASNHTSGYHGFYIEFKKPGEKMSDNQAAFAEFLKLVNYKWIVVTDWKTAAREVIAYLGIEKHAPLTDDLLAKTKPSE